MQGFSKEKFFADVTARTDQIDEQIMDLLLSFSDFQQFKEIMLFSKATQIATTPKMLSAKAISLGLNDKAPVKEEATASSDLVNKAPSAVENTKVVLREDDQKHFEGCIDKLAVSGHQTVVHTDEMEEGEEMPDLNLDIRKV